MTTLEKLYKTLELCAFIKRQNKTFVETNILERNAKLKKFNKQDKLKHCSLIGECISKLNSKDKCDIPNLIKICMELFFTFCNDQEQDVRTNASECLNRLINSKFQDNSAKIQNELLKELMKNESQYSIVIALNCLTSISHLMRPSRSKTFFISLLPCLFKLIEQIDDELIQDSLNSNIDTLMRNFIKFGTDQEVINLLNAFIKNLYLDNKFAKRTAANCLKSICDNSKKKYDMIFWLLNELFKNLLDNQLNENRNQFLIGTYLSLKTLIPLLQNYRFQDKQDINFDLSINLEDKKIINQQVITIKNNLLLFYLIFLQELELNNDNQVISILLEFLQTLLKSLPKVFQLLFKLKLNQKFNNLTNCEFNNERMKNIYDNFFSHLQSTDNKLNDNLTYLEYTTTLICSRFLLNNNINQKLKSDEQIKVLIKCLALNCLAKLIEFKPNLIKLEIYENNIKVIDVLGYSNHYDSNLTGHSSFIVSCFIKSKLILNSFNNQNLKEDEDLIMKLFFKHIYLSLDNKSSVHLKLVLNSIKNCLNEILNSNSIINLIIIDLLRKLITFSNHPYWLIKVELLEIFSSLNYKSICYLERNLATKFALDSNIQLLILNNVFYNLLVDSDYRVRNSTIKNLIKLIPNLYFNNYNDSRNDEILSFAKTKILNQNFKHSKSFSFNLNSEQYKKINLFPDNPLPKSYGFLFPFSENIKDDDDFIINNDIEFNLKTIINHLVSNLIEKIENKLTLTGVLEALAELSDSYPTTKYAESWNITKSTKLIEFLFTYLTTTQNTILDISLHSLFIKLITNLICGCAYNEIKENSIFRAKSRSSIFERSFHSESLLNRTIATNTTFTTANNKTELDLIETCSMMSTVPSRSNSDLNLILSNLEQNWGNLSQELKIILKNIVIYFIRLLHVYSSVFSDNNNEMNKSFLTQVFKPNFSPLKRSNSMRATDLFEKSDLFKKFSDKDKQNSTKKEIQYPPQHLYTNDLNLIKLYDSIKKMYQSTLSTLDLFQIDPLKQNKLISFLNELLYSFSKILELGNHHYFGKLIDELIQLLMPIFTVQSTSCLQFIKQLIKVLFGTNFASVYEFEYPNIDQTDPNELDDLSYSSFISDTNLDQSNINQTSDLYSVCLLNDYDKLKERLLILNEPTTITPTTANKSKCNLEKEYYNVFYRKLFDKRMKSVLNQNFDDFINENVITNYLQVIQPILIDSMKNYTCTSSTDLHCSVLKLLNELVKVHVNYSNLDADQTFFTFLTKQFEFIENEQISSEKLIEIIFMFLISLSYDKSNCPLLTYPKIIQLMDNLQASEASFDLNVYPALSLIVEDLFLIRTISNSEDLKELETQKEYIINLLIKSAHLPKIIYLLNIILIEYKLDGEDKVKKLSRQITDELLQNLVKGFVNFKSIDDVNIVMKLFLSVSHVVFRPVDFVLNGIFSLFDDNLLNNQTSFLKFYSHKLILFNVLIKNSKEDIILNRLDELKINLVYFNIQIKDNSKLEDNELFYKLPVFYRSKTADKSINQDSKEIISKYLIKLILLALIQLDDDEQILFNETNLKFKEFLNQLLNQLLMNIYYMIKEDQFPKIKKCLKDNLDNDLNKINNYIRSLSINYPNLVLQWFNILIELYGELDKKLFNSIIVTENVDDLKIRFKNALMNLDNSNLINSDNINDQKSNLFLLKLLKNKSLNKQLDKHLYSSNLELIRRNCFLINFNYLIVNSNYLKNDNWLNEDNISFFIQHSKQESIVKIFNLISLDAELSIKFIEIINKMNLSELLNQRNTPLLIIERLLVFCSFLHKKSTKFLIDYLINNLYSNSKFIPLVSLRKMMLQIVNKKLKCFNFIQITKDERLDKDQILNLLDNLKKSNSCGLNKFKDETMNYLNDYLNALDLCIDTLNDEDNKNLEVMLPKEEFDPLLNNNLDNLTTAKEFLLDDKLSNNYVNKEKNSDTLEINQNELKFQLFKKINQNNLDYDDDNKPNQNWLIDTLLNNSTFNKSADLFVILNSNFSSNELLKMLEDERFQIKSRNIEFANNSIVHINQILESNLNYDIRPNTETLQFLKTSKFSLVISIRQLLIKLCNNLLLEFNLDSKSTYFSYLDEEEFLFDKEIDNFNKLNKIFINKHNREQLIKLTNLLSNFYEHINLIAKFDQVRKRHILNNQQDNLKNDEYIDKLIKLDNLDYNKLLRIMMLYCELIQFEINENDDNYINDCIILIRSFVNCDFLMNILSTYQYNSMQFTLIQSLYSYFKKKFNLFSVSNDSSLPKHFKPSNDHDDIDQQKQQHLDYNQLKYKHSHNACFKISEIINFIIKQSTELVNKDDHLLQNRKLYSEKELDNLVFITLIIARLPLINRFILVPNQVWKNDWQPKFVTLKQQTCLKEEEQKKKTIDDLNYYEADTFCATLPSEQLFDSDTLQTFIHLINLVGFTNRIQFEEIWMSLLGVISLNNDPNNLKPTEELFIEEVNEKANLIVLAIKGITSIILQCVHNEIGYPIKNLKKYSNRILDNLNDDYCRNKVFLNTKYGSKLLNLNKYIDQTSLLKFAGQDKDINENNFEMIILSELNTNYLNLIQFTEHFYENRYGLYSTEYLKKKFGLVKELGEINSINESSSSSSSSSTPVHQLNRSNSLLSNNGKEDVIKFKVYKNKENISVINNKMEIDVNSCIHFLLDFYKTIARSHIAVQEEVLKSIIKISDLFFDLNQFNKNIELFFDLFKTSFSQEDEILMQYLILGICKFYTITHETIQNDNLQLEKVKKSIEISLRSQFQSTRINCLVGLNYILQDKLNSINKGRSVLNQNKDHQIFLILKDYVLKYLFDKDLNKNIEHAILVWNSAFQLVDYFVEEFDESDFNQKLFRQLLLVLEECDNIQIYTVITNGIQRLLISEFFRIRECNKIVKICIDKLKRRPFYDYQTISSFYILTTSIYVFGLLPNGTQTNSDEEILNLENINILFSCLKKLDCNQNYFNLIVNCLPDISVDFIIDVNSLLNKIINEFLINQKNNVDFFAIILHKVITKLQKQDKQTVDNWILLSLKNFTQVKYAFSSVFTLLVVASTNCYIRSLFENLISNYGKLNDKKLLISVISNYMEELNPENLKLLNSAIAEDLDKIMDS